jgi:succinyl-diaminopimelate desuccinylase
LADRLRVAGLEVELGEHAPDRRWLVARLPGDDRDGESLCLSGHLDTVGLGATPWSRGPFDGEIEGDKLYGRGASDMKAAIAAMVIAMEGAAAGGDGPPVVLALSAGEETGCEGAPALAAEVGTLGALLVGESTCNRLAIAHKGVAWLTATARGRAAHASTPALGDNAVVRMAQFSLALEELDFSDYADPLLGLPSLSLGTVHGGTMVNIVPDRCDAEIDVRLTPALSPEQALSLVGAIAGEGVEVAPSLALPAVASELDDPWLERVRRLAGGGKPRSATYFTDAAVLAPACGHPPVAILGPGEPAQAHRVDEWCSVAAIESAAELYADLISDWRSR